jgi:hypothetical protein
MQSSLLGKLGALEENLRPWVMLLNESALEQE